MKEEEFIPKLQITEKLLKEMIEAAPVSAETKAKVLKDLPLVAENLDEITRKVYDPNRIWLESIQFADYVQQHAEHLRDCFTEEGHEDDCFVDISLGLYSMSEKWKHLAESSMKILDDMKITSKIYDFSEIIVGTEEKNETQQ